MQRPRGLLRKIRKSGSEGWGMYTNIKGKPGQMVSLRDLRIPEALRNQPPGRTSAWNLFQLPLLQGIFLYRRQCYLRAQSIRPPYFLTHYSLWFRGMVSPLPQPQSGRSLSSAHTFHSSQLEPCPGQVRRGPMASSH